MMFSRPIQSLVIGAMALLLTAAAARAYSDDAVKDAQKLLDSTGERFKFGEVTDTDVALARYNLLDMRWRAGQLDAAAFCAAAKPELAAVAAAFDPPDGHAADKQAWLAAIAQMGATRRDAVTPRSSPGVCCSARCRRTTPLLR